MATNNEPPKKETQKKILSIIVWKMPRNKVKFLRL